MYGNALLFRCGQCHTVDVVDLAYPQGGYPCQAKAWRCTQCQTGTWHDQFEKRPYDPQTDTIVNGFGPHQVTLE